VKALTALFLCLLTGLFLLAGNSFAEMSLECKTSYRVEGELSFKQPLEGYGYQVFELTNRLDQTEARILEAGTYAFTAVLKSKQKKIKRGEKHRCFYEMAALAVWGNGYELRAPLLRNPTSWIEFDGNTIEGISLGQFDFSALQKIELPDGSFFSGLYSFFGCSYFGEFNRIEKNSLLFEGSLFEGNQVDGFKKLSDSSLVLSPLARQDYF
jgi:hypothetical protein